MDLGLAVPSGTLSLPQHAAGVVLFAHGSGSSRFSSRNRCVAHVMGMAGIGTLLFDLLTTEEDTADRHTAELRFDIAAAASAAAAELEGIGAVVSRGGRPDLVLEILPRVSAPTLLIVGGLDTAVIEFSRQAYARLSSEKELKTIPGAGHLFEELGALDELARLAREWSKQHLSGS